MDIIGACEAEGYDFVTKNDNVYVFENKHNYVFVDTTEELIVDGTQTYISSLDFESDVSTLHNGYITLTYNIDPTITPGCYTKYEAITSIDNASVYDYLIEINVKEEGKATADYLNPGGLLNYIKISAKPGGSVDLQLHLPSEFRDVNKENLVFQGIGVHPTKIMSDKLESERTKLNLRLKDYSEYPSLAKHLFSEEDKKFLTKGEFDYFLDSVQHRVNNLEKVYSDGHIFVYNKESGFFRQHNLRSASTGNGERFALSGKSISSSVDALMGLKKFDGDGSQKESAKHILKHLDDLNIDIYAPNLTGRLFNTLKSSIGNEISLSDIEPGMVIASYNCEKGVESYSVLEVLDIIKSDYDKNGELYSVTVEKKPGFEISVTGDLDNYTEVDASNLLFFDEPEEYLSNNDSYFVMDKKVMEAAPLLKKLTDDEGIRTDLIDSKPQLTSVVTAVQNEINEERQMNSIWKVF